MVYRPQDRIWTASTLLDCPVTTAKLKQHLRVDDTSEDGPILSMGLAATAAAEAFTQRVLEPRTCTLRLTDLPTGREPIELPGGTVASVTSVIADAVTITGCTAIGHSPALLIPAADWPTVTGEGYPVTITYVAGMAPIPDDISMAIRLIVGDLFENRENSSEAQLHEVPTSACYLLSPHRIRPI
jgi:uncharacterized phiE125 gp8 family phage protein